MLKKLWCNLHQSYFLVFLCISIIVGTILALVFRINYFGSIWWCVLSIILFIITLIKPKYLFIVIAIISGFLLAFFKSSIELSGEAKINELIDQTVTVSGTINGDPVTDESGTKYVINNLHFGDNGEYYIHGALYISGYKNYRISRGDTVTVNGKLSSGFGTYAGYMWRPAILNHQKPNPGDLILNTRNWFAGRIKKLIKEPEINLGLSYLLGMKSGLPDDLSENLRTVGLVHIVVASGAHLSILVGIAKKIFGKLSRFSGSFFSILFILFFMSMVGWTPSIMRAGIMSILNIFASHVGRKIAPWRIILIVAASTLLINPNNIINLGWLLSFASFSGIMILGPYLTKYFFAEKKPGFIATTILTTLSATFMTLPITLYYYGQISLISIIANLIILPTLSYAMGLVFITGIVSGIPVIETIISWCTEKLLSFHIAAVEFFGNMPQFLIKIDSYQPQVFLIYFLIFIPLLIGLLREKMVKLRKENNLLE